MNDFVIHTKLKKKFNVFLLGVMELTLMMKTR